MYVVIIFIHRRDFRLYDNTTLNTLYQQDSDVIPIFIFNPEQIDPKKNSYFSNNLVEFMCNSLLNLQKEYSKRNIK
tara:strand:+ start:109 stop:336 length:228 start_codon:yes stop_codon:yes gene_type:complete